MEAERAEGTSGPAGAQEKLSPAWVVSPLFPLPTELPNTYFERMADRGDCGLKLSHAVWVQQGQRLPLPNCDRRDYYAVSWLQERFLDRGNNRGSGLYRKELTPPKFDDF